MKARKAAAVGWALLGVVFCWEVYALAYLVVAQVTGSG